MAEQRQSYQNYDPDLALLQGMAAGDVRALDSLYARHGGAILSFLVARMGNRQLAEEVLQDTMMAAWQHAGSFRRESSIRTWLLVIARNKAINMQRKQQPVLTILDDSVSSHDTGPLEKLERGAAQDAVRRAMQHLSPEHREILVLVFYHQLAGQEVAEVLGISVGTVKSRLHRAKEMLRRVLQRQGGL
jgi:RNA polymerase sigma-70 factor (ECF subfamily)